MGANQRASWDTSRGEVSSRARYLQRRVGARHGPLLCVTVTLVGLGLSLCKPNNSIVGRACGTAYLSVGPHASTIDGSSEWGWDLGVWMLAVCSAAAGIQLTRAKNRRAQFPFPLTSSSSFTKYELRGTSNSRLCYDTIFRTNTHH